MASNSETLAKIKLRDESPLDPLGFYVLVEVVEVENISDGGIYLGNQGREQSAEEAGYLRAIGPTAYQGWEGCEHINACFEGHDGPQIADEVMPYQRWGLTIGDLVEFRAFEGKKSAVPGFERWRYIPDSHIVGVIHKVN